MTNPTCSIDGCERPYFQRGWCQTHYTRNRRNGSPEALHRKYARTPEQRFDEYRKEMPSGCIEWQGGKGTGGYGSFRKDNKSWPAHRWIWIRTYGPIPDGLVVRHKCDNPPCTNTDHLELGTTQDNTQDMVDRERQTRGSIHHKAKLTERQVADIRNALRNGARPKDLGEYYGVTAGLISQINVGRIWKHVA
jgi:hypothetical protein